MKAKRMFYSNSRFLITASLVATVIISCSGCGDDPVKPVEPPRISQFKATPSDIMPGDSTLVSYTVGGAKTLKLQPGNVTVSPITSGTFYLKPQIPTAYSLIATNDGGRDSSGLLISMNGAVPSIDRFELSNDTILIGDSTILIWKTTRTDSIVINNGLGQMIAPDTGTINITPTTNTTYTAIAYNAIGTDTMSILARIEVPFSVNTINGQHYLGTLGSSVLQPELVFLIRDEANQALTLPSLHFNLAGGDGTISADSMLPGAGGEIPFSYDFSGSAGYGLIHAFVSEIDTLEIKVRADVLRLGPDGQGQYIKFDDTYADILALIGTPARVDPSDDQWINYAVYEDELGVVLAVEDVNRNELFDANDSVFQIFLTTNYTQQTPEGIGIGSSIQAVRSAYGVPDTLVFDTVQPPAWAMIYDSLGAIFYAGITPPDSAIIEIHIWEPVTGAQAVPNRAPGKAGTSLTESKPAGFRRSSR